MYSPADPRTRTLIAALVLAVAVVLVGVLLYVRYVRWSPEDLPTSEFAGGKYQLTTQKPRPATITSRPGWNRYENRTGGYAFLYPADRIDVDRPVEPVPGQDIVFVGEAAGTPESKLLLEIRTVSAEMLYSRLGIVGAQRLQQLVERDTQGASPGDTFVYTPLEFAGEEAFEASFDIGMDYGYAIHVEHSGQVYRIRAFLHGLPLQPPFPLAKTLLSETQKEILESFEFLPSL